MTETLVYHRVEDYDAWRRVFDSVIAGEHKVWRGQDDPNLMIIWEPFASRSDAEAAFGPATIEAMSKAGVDASSVRIEYLDHVTAGNS